MADEEKTNNVAVESSRENEANDLLQTSSDKKQSDDSDKLLSDGGDIYTKSSEIDDQKIRSETEQAALNDENLDRDDSSVKKSPEIDEESLSEDLKKQKLLNDYMELIKLIDAQNRLVDTLKQKLRDKCKKKCRTKCENAEIKHLRCCIEKENSKLQCLVHKVMELQEEDSVHDWKEVSITTTFEEDHFPLSFNFEKNTNVLDDEKGESSKKSKHQKGLNNEEDFQNFLSCLVDQTEKNKRYKSSSNQNHCDDLLKTEALNALLNLLRENGLRPKSPNKSNRKQKESELFYEDKSSESELDEYELKNRVCDLLRCMSKGKDSKCSKNTVEILCQQLMDEIQISQDKLVNDNSNLESDRLKLQEELEFRDIKIADLNKKYAALQKELYNLTKESDKEAKRYYNQQDYANRNESLEMLGNIRGTNMNLMLGVSDMQSIVNCFKSELESLKKLRTQRQSVGEEENLNEERNTNGVPYISGLESDFDYKKKFKSDELAELETNYGILLADYTAKEAEVNCLKEKMKNCMDSDRTDTRPSGKKHENVIQSYRKKITDLQEEQENFKSIFVEQSELLKDYQNKLQLACQKVEEQRCFLGKVETENKCIEEQINTEIQHIKDKFQEKLHDLAEIPILIENEKVKLSVELEEKAEIERKLYIVCRDYQELKCKYQPPRRNDVDDSHWEDKYKMFNEELESLKIVYENLKKERDDFSAELKQILTETDAMRTEAAREIARIKEKSEQMKETMIDYIRRIEKDLVECRINTTHSIEDREKIITKMRKQLNILSLSFDAAQKQIRTLRTHVQKVSMVCQ